MLVSSLFFDEGVLIEHNPVNAGYHWNQDYPASQLHSPTVVFNEYEGGVFQQAASAQAYTDSRTYELTDGEFSVVRAKILFQ